MGDNKRMSRYLLLILLCCASMMTVSSAAYEADRIVIDPGHGGYDSGIVAGALREKDLTLDVARALKERLEANYKQVELARSMDHYVDIEERARNANNFEPQIFLSLHLTTGPHARIYTVKYQKASRNINIRQYYSLDERQRRFVNESSALGASLGAMIESMLGIKVEFQEMEVSLLKRMGAPAVLVELPAEGFDYSTRMGELSTALYNGIGDYEELR